MSSRGFSRLRFLRAYRAVLLVMGSYLGLALQKRLFGAARFSEKTDRVHRRNASRIERTVLDLKGLFIKVGQMLSIMSNFLPEALTQGLERLQDAVPPHPYEAIEARLRQEFRKGPRELFASFDETPIASASLGQVHVASLRDGTKVAVKVQYPEIDAVVRSDLKTLKRVFGLLDLFFPAYGLRNVYREIADVILQELDYVYEGKNIELLKKNFEGEEDFLFPDVFWEFSTSKVLTLRFMEGIKVSHVDTLKGEGISPTGVATKIIQSYCKQIFVDGVYHADPHPGNLLVQKSGEGFRIVLVDFGATARISERMRHGITLFAEGLIKRDTRLLANAVREMGFVARPDSFEPFDRLVDYFYEKLSHIKIENFRNLDLSQFQNLEDLLELRKIKLSFRDLMNSFHVPKDWILLERAMILAMGLCTHLDPGLNPIDIVLPYVERFVLRDKSLTEVALALSKELALSYIRLPHEVQRTLRRLNEGGMAIRLPDLAAPAERLVRSGRALLYGFLCVSGLWLAAAWESTSLEAYGKGALYGALFFGLLLAGSLLRGGRR